MWWDTWAPLEVLFGGGVGLWPPSGRSYAEASWQGSGRGSSLLCWVGQGEGPQNMGTNRHVPPQTGHLPEPLWLYCRFITW